MSDPGFTRSDLCSIRAAAEQAEFAGAARACSTPTATHWPAMARPHRWRVMSPAVPPRRPSRCTTATGTTSCGGSAGRA